MERQEALRRLRKMLGKQFAYEYRPDAPSEEERAEAKARHAELAKQRQELSQAVAARQQYLLQNDATYQELRAKYKLADKAVTANNGAIYLYKFTVGTANKLFFHVKAQGNSWEEIFAKLKAERKS